MQNSVFQNKLKLIGAFDRAALFPFHGYKFIAFLQ